MDRKKERIEEERKGKVAMMTAVALTTAAVAAVVAAAAATQRGEKGERASVFQPISQATT